MYNSNYSCPSKLLSAIVALGVTCLGANSAHAEPTPPEETSTRVEVPVGSEDIASAYELARGTEATAVRFEYENVVGEYSIADTPDWATPMKEKLIAEYGTLPQVTSFVFDSGRTPDPDDVARIEKAVSESVHARSSNPAPVAEVTIDREQNSDAAQDQDAQVSPRSGSATPAWYPSWSRTNAQVLDNGTREISVSLEWANGRSPGGGKWGGVRGMEIETVFFNPDARKIGRSPGPTNANSCSDKDRAFWTARKWDSQVDFWALESPQGLDVRPAKPYFDSANYFDSCQFMNQAVGIGIPERLPEQPGNPGYWLYQTKIHGVTGNVDSSAMLGNIDPVSNNCSGGAIHSSCMGISDTAGGTDVPSQLLFNLDRGFRAPGCVIRDGDNAPVSCS